jgi:transposase
MTKTTTRARYTLEFKQEAVRLVEGGQSIAAAARTLGVVDQTLFNWVKAHRAGKLTGADSKVVSTEQMEISRLRAELARVKMERDILGKGDPEREMLQWSISRGTRTPQRQRSEVRLPPTPPARVADLGAVPGAAGQRGGLPGALRSACQRCPAPPSERRRAAGAHQGHPRRDALRLRCSSRRVTTRPDYATKPPSQCYAASVPSRRPPGRRAAIDSIAVGRGRQTMPSGRSPWSE